MAKSTTKEAEAPTDYGVPISCDVFERTPESIEDAEARGVDPVICFVRVHRVGANKQRGPRITHGRDSQWTPEVVNVSWLLDTFGPGHYDCVGVNSSGMVIAMGRVEVANPEDSHVPTPPAMPEGGAPYPTPPGWPPGYPPPPPGYPYPWQMPPQAPRPEPLREAVAAMAELITLDIQRSRLALESSQGKSDTEKQLVQALIAIAARPAAPAGNGQSPGADTALAFLKIGMSLVRSNGKGAAGADGAEPDETAWRTIVPQIVDSIGPGAIATLAQLFPKDKADAVVRLLEQHMTTRKAEAEADAAGAPVDVPGETVTP